MLAPSYHHDGIVSSGRVPASACADPARDNSVDIGAGGSIVRLNITMDEDVYRRLKRELPPKKISAFIEDVVGARLYPDQTALDTAYEAAQKERWKSELSSEWAMTETESWLSSASSAPPSVRVRGRRR
jgi:hypothetical protein